MTIEEVWWQSRWDSYAWLLPTVMVVGTVLILLLSQMRPTLLRRLSQGLVFTVVLCLAVQSSGT